jgi:ubiquinone/menaquinone biosynthesis C-methylase UbiE
VDHADHVALIRTVVEGRPGTWADLGSGAGAFTLALADVLGDRGSIVSVDRDAGALAQQTSRVAAAFPQMGIAYVRADFTHALELPLLDGILMANSLHFIRDKERVLEAVLGHLRPGGSFLLVEYDADRGNPWVPHPISFASWQRLAPVVGLSDPRLMGRVPSRFLGSIYSAASQTPASARWTTRPMHARADLEEKEAVRRALDDG